MGESIGDKVGKGGAGDADGGSEGITGRVGIGDTGADECVVGADVCVDGADECVPALETCEVWETCDSCEPAPELWEVWEVWEECDLWPPKTLMAPIIPVSIINDPKNRTLARETFPSSSYMKSSSSFLIIGNSIISTNLL